MTKNFYERRMIYMCSFQMGGQLQSVMKALRLFDYNRDGHIQKHELKRVIENFCFRLTDEQFNKYVKKITQNKITVNLDKYFFPWEEFIFSKVDDIILIISRPGSGSKSSIKIL